MDDPQVARDAFTSSNIDFDRLFARAQQQDVKDRLLKLTQDAVARGAIANTYGALGSCNGVHEAAHRLPGATLPFTKN